MNQTCEHDVQLPTRVVANLCTPKFDNASDSHRKNKKRKRLLHSTYHALEINVIAREIAVQLKLLIRTLEHHLLHSALLFKKHVCVCVCVCVCVRPQTLAENATGEQGDSGWTALVDSRMEDVCHLGNEPVNCDWLGLSNSVTPAHQQQDSRI